MRVNESTRARWRGEARAHAEFKRLAPPPKPKRKLPPNSRIKRRNRWWANPAAWFFGIKDTYALTEVQDYQKPLLEAAERGERVIMKWPRHHGWTASGLDRREEES